MNHPKLSRRGLLKGTLAAGGAVVGTRMGGPLVREALAAPEKNHFVHIFFNGGFNAVFAGNADKFLTNGAFGTNNGNVKNVGNGVFTDAATLGTLPDFALQHWGAIGFRHGSALHTTPQNLNSGGERAILRNGGNCYLNQLAYYMGGDSAFKAVYFGDRAPAYQNQPTFQGVPLQRVLNLSDAIKALGAQGPSPDDPDRGLSSASIAASETMSERTIATNPGRLSTLTDAYGAAIEALKKPPPPPVTFDEISRAYGLNGRTTADTFPSMLAGAELMIRAADSNVINITDFGLASWDFHQTNGAGSINAQLTRNRMLGQGGFTVNRLAPIRTFLARMLNLTDRNVVVALSGELVRLPNGDHGDGTVAAVFGKNIKRGVSYPVNNQSRFAASTPPVASFWAAIAAAVKVPGTPFGGNPHSAITG